MISMPEKPKSREKDANLSVRPMRRFGSCGNVEIANQASSVRPDIDNGWKAPCEKLGRDREFADREERGRCLHQKRPVGVPLPGGADSRQPALVGPSGISRDPAQLAAEDPHPVAAELPLNGGIAHLHEAVIGRFENSN